ICWDWMLRDEDRSNPVIRAALHLDEVPIPEHNVHEFGMSMEEGLRKKIEDNKQKLVQMNEELRSLAAFVYSAKEHRKQPHFCQEGGTCGVDGDDELDDDVEGVMEEDNEDVHDVLDVAPLVSRKQQNEAAHILDINPKYLYSMVIPFRLHSSDYVVSEICGQVFVTADCHSFGPRKQLGNMGILFGASVFMFFERRRTGVVRRICFSPLYAVSVNSSHLILEKLF
ncbi:hypothetical protein V8G54_010702, partial [Vigna mungo]